ncbi:MAG: TonB-dependent receptor domain-containing protein, partial [Chitinophagaceae bacterium]
MRKLFSLGIFLLFVSVLKAQNPKQPAKDTTKKPTDSSLIDELKENLLDNIPTVSLSDDDFGDAGSQNISSVLTAGRDAFFSAAAFSFSPARFRMRGYDNDLNATFMNGIPMDNLDNGFTPFGLWGGLNDVMRNRDLSIGLRYNTFSFGDIGSSTNIDSRASKQRKQTQVGYAISNRNYTHRVNVYHGSGVSKKGWAYVVAGSFRGADEGYIPGTYYNGYSYFVGVDKRIKQKHLLSLVAFGAPTENGRQSSAVQEAMDLVGSKYYNPTWGYQNGKKRNANVAKAHQPYIILTHDYRISNNTSLVTALGYSFGERATSALDWNNAADPRPDYYRYLPSYQQDPVLKQRIAEEFANNTSYSQINWNALYQSNLASFETINNVNGIQGNTFSGRRSRYILEDRVINTKRFNFNSVFNSRLSNHIDVTAGASYQNQKNNYFKRINDLLGGEFYVDFNQFAERDFPSNPDAAQNNVLQPNRILRTNDKFGYNYDINVTKAATWAQGVFKFSEVDFYLSAEVSTTSFQRNGNYKNGLYPNNSFGKSTKYTFNNYSLKGGVTYKINGRNYLYIDGAALTRAPYFDNVFISPRTRDLAQPNISSETITSFEGGYVLNSPKIKARLTGYYTRFDNQMNVITFFHDDFRNFVNYSLNNIDKVHFGGELGFEAKILPNVTLNGAAAVGRYYFDSEQEAKVTLDNSSEVLAQETIYSKNFRVGGTPQEAYSLGIQYRSPKFWFAGLTGNYFDQIW